MVFARDDCFKGAMSDCCVEGIPLYFMHICCSSTRGGVLFCMACKYVLHFLFKVVLFQFL